jgi:uncharacterized protein (UPF0332 family)
MRSKIVKRAFNTIYFVLKALLLSKTVPLLKREYI